MVRAGNLHKIVGVVRRQNTEDFVSGFKKSPQIPTVGLLPGRKDDEGGWLCSRTAGRVGRTKKGGVNPEVLNVHTTYAHAKDLKPGLKGDGKREKVG